MNSNGKDPWQKQKELEASYRPAAYPCTPQGPPEGERGDAHDDPEPAPSPNGAAPAPPKNGSRSWPAPIPASQLELADPARYWLWQGYLSRGNVTLLSALWKSGKTTLLAHLLKAFEGGGMFCDFRVESSRILYVTEESQSRWAKRRDDLALRDHVEFLVRPFAHAKPATVDWVSFLTYLHGLQVTNKYDLIVLDSLTELWPVTHENDAAEVQAALQPLRQFDESVGLLLNHHLRKGDGTEATASRGSGALLSFVDTILELRRYDITSRTDRRRVLSAYGRDDETSPELVIELAEDGSGYRAHGDRAATRFQSLLPTLVEILPAKPPGLTVQAIREAWPASGPPCKQTLLDVLAEGVRSHHLDRQGSGIKGEPFLFWRVATNDARPFNPD
jgi:hypothetical protein